MNVEQFVLEFVTAIEARGPGQDTSELIRIGRWSVERLRREARRLGIPGWKKMNHLQLLDNVMEAYS